MKNENKQIEPLSKEEWKSLYLLEKRRSDIFAREEEPFLEEFLFILGMAVIPFIAISLMRILLKYLLT